MGFSMMAALNGNHDHDYERNIPEIKLLDIDNIVADENNFYRVVDDEAIERQNELLQADILARGIQQPIAVKPLADGKFKIISGHRRTEICRRLVKAGHDDFKLIPAIIKIDVSTDPDDVKNIETEINLIMSNATTRELSDWEKVQQVSRLNELYKGLKKAGKKIPGRVNELIAEKLNLSKTQVGRYGKIDKNLSSDYKKQLKNGKIAISTADALASKSAEEQKKMYQTNPKPKLDDVAQKNNANKHNQQKLQGWHQLIYCAHKYRDPSPEAININKNAAQEKIAALILKYPDVCFVNPIESVSWMKYWLSAQLSDTKVEEIAMKHCLALLKRCDQLWVLSEVSEGVKQEIAFAKAHKIAILYGMGDDNDEKN